MLFPKSSLSLISPLSPSLWTLAVARLTLRLTLSVAKIEPLLVGTSGTGTPTSAMGVAADDVLVTEPGVVELAAALTQLGEGLRETLGTGGEAGLAGKETVTLGDLVGIVVDIL